MPLTLTADTTFFRPTLPSEEKSVVERLREFIALSKGCERSEAETILSLFDVQTEALQNRFDLLVPIISQLVILMFQ